MLLWQKETKMPQHSWEHKWDIVDTMLTPSATKNSFPFVWKTNAVKSIEKYRNNILTWHRLIKLCVVTAIKNTFIIIIIMKYLCRGYVLAWGLCVRHCRMFIYPFSAFTSSQVTLPSSSRYIFTLFAIFLPGEHEGLTTWIT